MKLFEDNVNQMVRGDIDVEVIRQTAPKKDTMSNMTKIFIVFDLIFAGLSALFFYESFHTASLSSNGIDNKIADYWLIAASIFTIAFLLSLTITYLLTRTTAKEESKNIETSGEKQMFEPV